MTGEGEVWQSEVGVKSGENTPTFADGVLLSAVCWRRPQKVGVRMAINTPTFDGCFRLVFPAGTKSRPCVKRPPVRTGLEKS